MPESENSAIQARYIAAAFSDAALYPPGSTPGGVPPLGQVGPVPPAEFFFRVGYVLAREEDQAAVGNILEEQRLNFRAGHVSVADVVDADPEIPGLARFRLVFQTPDGVDQPWPGKDKGEPDPNLLDKARITTDALVAIQRRLGPGRATPEHLLSVTTNGDSPDMVTWCPANEPTVPKDSAPVPGVSDSHCNGKGTRVVVVDEGLVQNAAATHSWMHGVTGDPDLGSPVGGPIKLYGGHGTFIASIIRAMAPQATVHVARVLAPAAAAWETDVVRALRAVMNSAPVPDVISLSAGTHTWMNGGSLSFIVFVPWLRQKHPGTVLVAAAGNDGADWKFAPAEMGQVIGVGALDASGQGLATWSNRGDWVKVYAPGEDLVQAFGNGWYTYTEQPRAGQTADFHGMAIWSGTSFSTPIVAGLIAARMSGTGETAPEAAASLLRLAGEPGHALPFGPVLRPGQACLPVQTSG
jgi:hypothetical protein